jgi:lysophospholipase L1-like esterase
MQNYLYDLKKLLSNIPEDCPVFILVLPHCIQINEIYRDRMIELGAKVEDQANIFNTTFPFYEALTSEIKRKNIVSINALPFLQQASLTNAVYYENDPHLNSLGQEVLGENLIQIIRQYFESEVSTQ